MEHPISNYPPELWRNIAGYLNPKDALQLASVSEHLCSTALLPVIEAFRQAHWSGGYDTGDTPFRGPFLPVILPDHVHSVTVSCRWKDQGWGNLKGQLYIVGTKSGSSSCEMNGNVVCTSPIASHDWAPLELTFYPVKGNVYHMWYKVGGGGGHQLFVEQCVLRTVIFDKPDRSLSRNCHLLAKVLRLYEAEKQAVVDFYPKLLLANIRSFLKQQQQPRTQQATDDTLTNFFSSYGIPLTRPSLLAQEEFLQNYLDILETQRRIKEEETGSVSDEWYFDEDDDEDDLDER